MRLANKAKGIPSSLLALQIFAAVSMLNKELGSLDELEKEVHRGGCQLDDNYVRNAPEVTATPSRSTVQYLPSYWRL